MMNEYFPKLLKNKLFLIYTGVVIVLVVALVAFSGNLFMSYQQAEENRQKIQSMESFLLQFSEQKKFLENIEERPVKVSELDDVQTELFKQVKRYKLNLVKFSAKDPESKKEKSAQDFNLSISGDYTNVMEFLNDFHARNALMTIKFLNMHQNNGQINAEMVYSVYLQ